MKHLNYDLNVWRVFLKKRSNYNAAIHKQKMQWRNNVWENALKAADAFMTPCTKVVVYEKAADLFIGWTKFKQHAASVSLVDRQFGNIVRLFSYMPCTPKDDEHS